MWDSEPSLGQASGGPNASGGGRGVHFSFIKTPPLWMIIPESQTEARVWGCGLDSDCCGVGGGGLRKVIPFQGESSGGLAKRGPLECLLEDGRTSKFK